MCFLYYWGEGVFKMYRQQLRQDEAGYTLLEAILQIVVFALFAQLFVLFFYWKAPIERQYQTRSNVQFEMFAADFQEAIALVESIEVIRAGDGIRFQTDRGIITIEERNQVIRKTVDGQGHVPLMTEIVRTNFKLQYPALHVEVVMQDGSEMERDFIVGTNLQ